MTILNNVNVGNPEQVTREAETDKSKVKRTQKINGEWLLEEGGPQFRAEVNFEGGKIVMESDQPYYGSQGHFQLHAVAGGGSLYGSGGALCLASVPYPCSLRLVLKHNGG